ncbi:uncharacterized protein SEPMUDRAFT_149022, partial [Sphaerulina musiva SO2202]
PGLAWSRQLVWSCQCLHLQTRCACSSSSFQPFHTTTPPLYTNSLSLSLSLSLLLRLSVSPSALLFYLTPLGTPGVTIHRAAPHRTAPYSLLPLHSSLPPLTPHSPLTTDETRSATDLDFPIRTPPPSTHPSIAALRQPSIHCRAIASCLLRRHYSIQAGAQLVSAHDTHVQKHDRRDDERGY